MRHTMLRQCRFVDEVIPDIEWLTSREFLTKYKIDFVSHDAQPYLLGNRDGEDIFQWMKDANIFIETKRTEGVSTTDLLKCIRNTPENQVNTN